MSLPLKYIREQSGKYVDPKVVDAIMKEFESQYPWAGSPMQDGRAIKRACKLTSKTGKFRAC